MSSALYGSDLFGRSAAPKSVRPLMEKFLFPPFTVLDCRSWDWRERRRAWHSIGIKSDEGRDESLTFSGPTREYDQYRNRSGCERAVRVKGTSTFDPVLTEVVYRWFNPIGGQIVDPFSGGSVRGVVASILEMPYWGCDLRQEQVEANIAQAEVLCSSPIPQWVCGDSMEKIAEAPEADLIFSCPPYGDLEVYSDDPRDLSTMDWRDFASAYQGIIQRSVAKLRDDRFACFVVGNYRDPQGFYRDLVGLTIASFEECGARLYNEAVLVMQVGTASIRASKQFSSGRKLVKVHQNVLVFCKGNPKIATNCIGGAK